MGFLDKLLGKDESGLKVERIEFSELPTWIAMQKESLKGGLGERATLLADDLAKAREETLEKMGVLEHATMNKDVPERVKSIVSSSRDNYCSKVKKIINRIDTNLDPLKLSDELDVILEDIKKVDLKYGERANFGYRDDTQKVKKGLNKIVEASDKLNMMVEERKKKMKLLKQADKELKAIAELDAELIKLEERKRTAVDELKKAEHSKKDEERDLDTVEHSERVEKLKAMETEIENLNTRKQEIETFILNSLGPLKRVFKKYARAIKDGKASGINVEKYSENPVDTYLRGEHTLPELLAKIQKSIQTGTLDMDKGESEKAIKKIRAISFAYLEKSRSEYHQAVSQIRTLEVQMNEMSVDKEVERMQRDIENMDGKIASSTKKINKIEDEVEEKKLTIMDMNKSLAEKLSEFIGGRCDLL